MAVDFTILRSFNQGTTKLILALSFLAFSFLDMKSVVVMQKMFLSNGNSQGFQEDQVGDNHNTNLELGTQAGGK